MTRSSLLVALILASTALFAVGVIVERSSEEGEHTQQVQSGAATPQAAHEEKEATEGAGEEGSQAAAGEEGAHAEEERLLGLNVESTPMIVLAVVFGLVLAAACAAGSLRRRPGVLLAVAAVLIAWAALDIAELAEQIEVSRTGVALLAGAVAALHLAAAAVAFWSRRDPVA